jgi:hypothetical protein
MKGEKWNSVNPSTMMMMMMMEEEDDGVEETNQCSKWNDTVSRVPW